MRKDKDKVVDIEFVMIKHETEKAYLLVIEDKDVWVPRSMCEVDDSEKIVTMPEWLAIEKELV